MVLLLTVSDSQTPGGSKRVAKSSSLYLSRLQLEKRLCFSLLAVCPDSDGPTCILESSSCSEWGNALTSHMLTPWSWGWALLPPPNAWGLYPEETRGSVDRIGCGYWGYRSQNIQLEALYKPHPDIPVQEASVGKREEKIKSSWGWHNRFHSDDRVKDLWFIQQCKNQTSKVILIQKILLS